MFDFLCVVSEKNEFSIKDVKVTFEVKSFYSDAAGTVVWVFQNRTTRLIS